MRVLLLGGTRFTGRRLAEQLVAAGAQVTVLRRGTTDTDVPGTQPVSGDRSSPDGLEAVRGRRFDAVVDFSAYDATWVERAIDALAPTVGHYVFLSSGTVYSPSPQIPRPESAPALGNPAWGAYAQHKVRAEDLLRAAHQHGRLTASIVRLPFVLGPANYADREAFILDRLRAGDEILLPDGGWALNQHVHVADAAAALKTVLERPGVSGGLTLNIARPGAITNRGLVELFAQVSGFPARLRSAPRQVGSPGYTVDLTDLVFPFPDEHFVLDTGRATTLLNFTAPRRIEEMVEDFHAWWRDQPPRPPRRYPAEQRARATPPPVP